MATYDAGVMRSEYVLDLTNLERNARRAKQILDDLAKAETAATAPKPATPRATSARGADPAIQAAKAEAAILRQARAESMLAQAEGDTARAAQILAAALDKVDKSTVGAINTQTQYVRLLGRMETNASSAAGRLQVLPRTIAGLSNEAAAFATSAIGITSVGAAVAVLGSAMTDAADRTRQIKTALGELSDAEIQGISAAAVQLQAQYGTDLQRQLNATRVVMRSFGVDGVQATRIIQAGFANGLDVSGDFLDTLVEYGPYFETLGLSAEQSLGVLQRGLQAGARNTDYIGDALKELTIRIQDVATVGKLEELDAGMANVVRQFQAGETTAAATFDAIRNGLAAVKDNTLRNALGVELYGAKWEDLQGSVVTAMTDIEALTVSVDDINTGFQTLGEIGPRAFAVIGEKLQPINDWLLSVANSMRDVLTLSEQLDGLQASLIGASNGYEEYQARAAAANAELSTMWGVAGTRLDTLTRAQFDYAQVLIAQGHSEAAATQAARERAESLNALNAFITTANLEGNLHREMLAGLGPTMIAIAASSDEAAASMMAQVLAYQSGTLGAEGLRDAVTDLGYQTGVLMDAEAVRIATLAQTTQMTDARINAERAAAESVYAMSVATLTEAANTEIAALKQREFDDAITSAVGSSASAKAAALRLAAIYQGVSVPALIELINLRRELNTLEGRRLVGNLGGMARSARVIARQTRRDVSPISRTTGPARVIARQTRRDVSPISRTTGSGSVLRAPTRTATEDLAIRQARESAARIEQIERDHLSRMRDLQADYALTTTRNREDFEREKRRLLAEGNIREAQLLEERYNRESRRAAEDQAIKERKERENTAERIAEERAKIAPGAAIPTLSGSTRVDTPVVGTRTALASVPTAPAVQPVIQTIRVEIAPTAVQIDGDRIATIVYPPIERKIDAAFSSALMTVQVTAPPNAAQSTGVGGPRA